MKNKTLLVIGSVCFLLGAFILGIKFYKSEQAKDVAVKAETNMNIFVKDYSPKLGSEKAKVVLVEFFDPECESCREFYPYVKMLMDQHQGDIQLVLRYAPFHPNSKFIVKILEASRLQNRYFEALETLYENQPQWASHHDPKPELVWGYLEAAGIDIAKVKEDMNSPEIQKIIDQDIKDGQDLGVRMTPTFFVNGRPLDQFGYEQLGDAVKAALEAQ